MWHSVEYIGKSSQEISDLRKDEKRFNKHDFFEFAKENKEKYNLQESGIDLLVSTWHSDQLVKNYKKTINLQYHPTICY